MPAAALGSMQGLAWSLAATELKGRKAQGHRAVCMHTSVSCDAPWEGRALLLGRGGQCLGLWPSFLG